MPKQFYPDIARQKKLTGEVKLSFKIKPDGSLEYVKILQSSGHEQLDHAALQTIKRATPLPYYPDGIALSLDYQLK